MGGGSSTQSTKEELKHQIAVFEQEIAKLDKQIAEFTENLDEPSATEQPEEESENLKKSIAKLNRTVETTGHAELEDIHEAKLKLQESIEQRKKLLADFTAMRKNNQLSPSSIILSDKILKRHSGVNDEESQLFIKVQELDKEIAKFREQLDVKRVEQLLQQQKQAEEETRVETLNQEITELDEKLNTGASEINQLKERLEELIAEAETDEPDLAQVQAKENKLAEKLAQLEARVEELENGENSLEQLRESFKAKERELEEEDQALIAQLHEANRRKGALLSRIADLKA